SALGAEKPIVFGHSYGGAVALAWALENPGDISGLVVVSGVSNPWPGSLNPIYPVNASPLGAVTVVPIATAFRTEAAVNTALNAIFAPQSPPDGYADTLGVGLSTRRESLRANARQITRLKADVTEMAPFYPGISVPTEIVHGTADTIVPLAVHAEPLSRQIPGARLTPLEGIGHMPHRVAERDVIAAIDRAAARAGLR
ncbi:MAG: alpha/beta hydrolase, partial [Pseudomonadota bacterium]